MRKSIIVIFMVLFCFTACQATENPKTNGSTAGENAESEIVYECIVPEELAAPKEGFMTYEEFFSQERGTSIYPSIYCNGQKDFPVSLAGRTDVVYGTGEGYLFILDHHSIVLANDDGQIQEVIYQSNEPVFQMIAANDELIVWCNGSLEEDWMDVHQIYRPTMRYELLFKLDHFSTVRNIEFQKAVSTTDYVIVTPNYEHLSDAAT